MVTQRTSTILLFLALTGACNSPEINHGQATIKDTVNVDQAKPDSLNYSMFVLDTTVTSNFQGDTLQQIDKTLKLVADFDKASTRYNRDTFAVYEKTTEGCEIIAVNDRSSEFVEFYGTLFGEMGKTEFKFYMLVGRNPKLACAIFTDISCDKPMYEKDMQIRETKTNFQIFTDNKLIAVLDEQKQKENSDAKKLKAMEDETRLFFRDYIGQIKIVK
jgi:hypothetical protein